MSGRSTLAILRANHPSLGTVETGVMFVSRSSRDGPTGRRTGCRSALDTGRRMGLVSLDNWGAMTGFSIAESSLPLASDAQAISRSFGTMDPNLTETFVIAEAGLWLCEIALRPSAGRSSSTPIGLS